MKTQTIVYDYCSWLTCRASLLRGRLASMTTLAAVLTGIIGYSLLSTVGQAQEPENAEQGVEALTRGPVHEAFAGVVTYNPEPGVVVPKEPPTPIEEIPPAERPEGNNVSWIPGYWAWDDERNDFIWVSGTWRALPPGREWIAGYWSKVDQGYQWTSGYWADIESEETTYLPPPPATVETGPSTEAPSNDYSWSPGYWVWRQERYAWTPGYWNRGRADWVWIPAHYVWTPRGYVFIDGYWDYSVRRRGTLFAPVYYSSGLYARSGYNYTPWLALDLALFAEHLFLRPRYCHYYFGDYYANSYNRGGYYAAYAYQSNRRGYDPIFSHRRWEHRTDRDWSRRIETNYLYRRDHEDARPPRTWTAMRSLDANSTVAKQNSLRMAAPLDQMAKRKDNPVRFQTVAKTEQKALAERGKEVQKWREQRRSLETTGIDKTATKPGEISAPVKLKTNRSPIASKPISQLSKTQAPPTLPKAPKTVDQPKSDRGKLQTGPRKADQLPDGMTPTDPRKAEPSPRDKTSTEPRRTEPAERDRTPTEPRRTGPTERDKTPTEPRRTGPTERDKTPTEPRRVEPTPRDKTPTERRRVEPTPRDKTPTERRRVEPTPRDTTPTEPRRVEPTPRDKTPTEPRRAEPTPREAPPRVKPQAEPRRVEPPVRSEKRIERPAPRAPEQPSKPRSGSGDGGDDKPDKKDSRKN